MKKRICLLALLWLLSMPCLGAGEDVFEQQKGLLDVEEAQRALPPGSPDILAEMGSITNPDVSGGLGAIWNQSRDSAKEVTASALGNLLRVLVVLVLCGCALGFSKSAATPLAEKMIVMVGASALFVTLITSVRGMIHIGSQTLEELDIFSKSLLPLMTSAAAMSGAGAAGTIAYGATAFAFDAAITLVARSLFPMVYVYLVLCTIHAAIGEGMLERLCAFLHWLVSGVLKIILLGFVGYLSIVGGVAVKTSAAAVKTAKFAFSGGIPVVGRLFSDATEAFFSGAELLKNSVGVFGMLGIVSICLIPMMQSGLNYFLFKAGAAVMGPLAPSNLGKLVGTYSEAFGLIFSMICTCAAILFFEMVFVVMMVKVT